MIYTRAILRWLDELNRSTDFTKFTVVDDDTSQYESKGRYRKDLLTKPGDLQIFPEEYDHD